MKKLFSALMESETTWAEAMENRGVEPRQRRLAEGGDAHHATSRDRQGETPDVAAQSKAKREEPKPPRGQEKPEDAISTPVASSQKGQVSSAGRRRRARSRRRR